jgi:prophage antirepressor-like protein
MDKLRIFEHAEFGAVRFMNVDGTPYAYASDVAKVLGYQNSREAVKDHCIRVAKRYVIENSGFGTHSIEINLIPESDIYRLIMRSHLPNAIKFQTWVCEDVLPAIRKDGTYTKEPLSGIDLLIQSAMELKRLDEQQKAQAEEQAAQERRLSHVERTISTSQADWFTVKAFANLKGVHVNNEEAKSIGILAAKKCREKGITPGKTKDTVFGKINNYPEDILEMYF